MMLVPFVYMGRKRLRRSSGAALRGWLEVHLFCGIVGPVLVTLHTSFKFNGIVSAAYWSMMIVMLSGFVGRYLYVRIPRSLRGVELSRAELDAQAQHLHDDVEARAGGAAIMAHIDALERRTVPAHGRPLSWTGLLFGEIGVRLALRRFRSALAASGLRPGDRDALLRLTTERVLLLRRAEYLQRTKKAFSPVARLSPAARVPDARHRLSCTWAWRSTWATCRSGGDVMRTGRQLVWSIAAAAVFSLLGAARADAQLGALLSPGPLAKAHSTLEGAANCQKCHEARQQGHAPRSACRATRRSRSASRARSGVHRDVTDECVSCHADHAGVDGELRPFDQARFNHATEAGYALIGKHAAGHGQLRVLSQDPLVPDGEAGAA